MVLLLRERQRQRDRQTDRETERQRHRDRERESPVGCERRLTKITRTTSACSLSNPDVALAQVITM